MTSPLLVRDGAVALGGRPVLRGVDLEVGDGEVVALLGHNGSGKSTLVRASLGLVPFVRGDAALFGMPLARFTGWRRVGYVPQRPPTTAAVPATVWEVVASGRLARRRLFRPLARTDRSAIERALEAVHLADRSRDSATELSGGQQQRVLIARALAGEPDLLVLDEPTAGIDLYTQRAFAEAVHGAVREGATVLLVAHDLGPLAPLVDRTVVLRDGRVVYDGPPRSDDGVHTFHDHARPEGPEGPHILDPGWRL
jgi:zinc transport system ATP-binding protein